MIVDGRIVRLPGEQAAGGIELGPRPKYQAVLKGGSLRMSVMSYFNNNDCSVPLVRDIVSL